MKGGYVVMNSFCFKSVLLVDVSLYQKGENAFTFLIVMDQITYEQAKLIYFGELNVVSLEALKGSVVNVQLKPSAKGFNAIDVVKVK